MSVNALPCRAVSTDERSDIASAIEAARVAWNQPSKALRILRDAAGDAQSEEEREALAAVAVELGSAEDASLYVRSAAPELADQIRQGTVGLTGVRPLDSTSRPSTTGGRWAAFASALDAGQVFENLVSLRIIITALIAAGIVGAGAEWVWEPLGVPVGLTVLVATWLLLALSPTTVLFCPFCRKRVKLGASHCHHCGRAVS
jgi:hypothetical protein